MIADATAIVGRPLSVVELLLGQPTDVENYGPGEVSSILSGGQIRAYMKGKYEIQITVDLTSVVRGFQVTQGLDDENYALSQWRMLLARVGLNVSKQPDVSAPAGLHWNNVNGYKIAVLATKINGPVWTIQVDQAGR